MKDFWKFVLATVVGLLVLGVAMTVLGLFSIIGIVASSNSTQTVSNNSVLVLNLSGIIKEQAQEDILSKLSGDALQQQGLNDMLSAIKKAKTNAKIKGIYIEAGSLSTDGYSTLLELRNALLDFKTSGKWIVAYGDNYTQGAYFLSSVADKVYLNPNGAVDIHGIATNLAFVKDLYKKFGVKFQIIKVGKYKSATEAYSEDHMSDANREQVTAFVTGLWDNICEAIAESRGISADSLNAYADRLTAFSFGDNLQEMGLVDSLLYHDEVKAEVRKLLNLKEKDEIRQLSVSKMRNVKEDKKKGGEIAVYYAYGSIVDSPMTGIWAMGSPQIVGTEMSRDLEGLMNDDDVKAVVIRVNSPGGSAYASEQIWHQVTKLKEKKPVVISMGDYAASGGYYISCNASWVVAQPTTLTGSIGIFGVIPEAQELLEDKLGLHFDGVKTNRHADLMANMYGMPIRPFDAEETAIMQEYIERGYSLFRKRVADGREQEVERIEEIAQGHVWLGQDAIGINLVDQLGGLGDAVEKAAELASLDEYHTSEYPEPSSLLDQLLGFGTSDNNYLTNAKALLGDWYLPFMALKAATEQSPVQASLPYFLFVD